jgi:hypothetical protein
MESIVAQRGPIHHPAGTIERKSISVTVETYLTVLDSKVCTCNQRKWPNRNREIAIQQDGASSHIKREEPESVLATATIGNWKFALVTQPAQSPDTNQLDLTFFSALQYTQWDNGFALEG